jgi:hypothetical protein
MIACFNNKKQTILVGEKVQPSIHISVTYCEFILDQGLLNVSGSHFLKLCISRDENNCV